MQSTRRDFIRTGAVAAGFLSFGPAFWREAIAAPARPGDGPYGPLQPPDANGIMLPQGFSSKELARGNVPVPGTNYVWHIWSDGAATYATPDGGWILVCNSEVPPDIGVPGQETAADGGASAIRFRPDGSIERAYRVLSGTSTNCAGGPTPWGTWLSCEEHARGRVWECDPLGEAPQKVHPAMGVFDHEAAAVDPEGRRVYLSEDHPQGGFYRYTPDNWPDLSSGLLEIATVQPGGLVSWTRVPDPSAASGPTRTQVPGANTWPRGEGMWFDSGIVYLCTTGDHRITTFDVRSDRADILYDGAAIAEPKITAVDNITAAPLSGDIFVCEDHNQTPIDIGIVSAEGEVGPFLTVTGQQHNFGELAGVCFDPSGRRMYFSSQRAFGPGVLYEITGPFRTRRRDDRRSSGRRIRVDSTRSASIESFLKRGLTVAVVRGNGARVQLTLTARMKDSRGRTRNTRIARRSRAIPEGRKRVEMELNARRKVRDDLRRRRALNATLTATITEPGGRTNVITRTIRFRSTRRRRRRRR